jgi:hypothetical protein
MAKKREVTPMETQPIRGQSEAATPMAPAPSKPSRAARRSTPPIRQAKLKRPGGAHSRSSAAYSASCAAERGIADFLKIPVAKPRPLAAYSHGPALVPRLLR